MYVYLVHVFEAIYHLPLQLWHQLNHVYKKPTVGEIVFLKPTKLTIWDILDFSFEFGIVKVLNIDFNNYSPIYSHTRERWYGIGVWLRYVIEWSIKNDIKELRVGINLLMPSNYWHLVGMLRWGNLCVHELNLMAGHQCPMIHWFLHKAHPSWRRSRQRWDYLGIMYILWCSQLVSILF
jgi:hypothetical protein